METKFTKGPWKATSQEVGVVDKSDTQSYGILEQVCWIEDQFCKSDKEAIANAHLIAAAPEMYEMLYEIFDHIQCGDGYRLEPHDIEQLLAKARGEQ